MFKDFVLPPLVLTIICIVVTVALVGTYEVTLPIIEAQKAAAADAARIKVLPEADSFTQVDMELPEGVLEVYEANNGTGYVITAVSSGYGGPMEVITGIRSDGSIAAVELMDNSETAGLGTKVGLPNHVSKYENQTASTLENVEFIGGATVSSRAMHRAVQSAYTAFGQLTGMEVPVDDGPVRDPLDDSVKTQLFPNVSEFETLEVGGEMYRAGDEGYIAVVSAEGFIDYITTAVALDNDGAVIAVEIVENHETDGYGSKLSGNTFKDSLVGITDADQIEGISGATVSSTAFVKSMEDAFNLYLQATGAIPVPTSSGATTAITRDPVADEVKTALFPNVDTFTAVSVSQEAYKAGSEGYIVVVEEEGFIDKIITAVAFDNDGTVLAIELVQNNETDGYGSKLSGNSFREAMVGITSADAIESISGATVSSNAFIKSMTSAFAAYEEALVAGKPAVAIAGSSPIFDDVKEELFPGAPYFDQLIVSGEAYKAGDAGYIVVVSADGFMGPITTAVAFDQNGAVLGVVITENDETDGYGSKLSGNTFKESLVGITSADQIEGISGATVSTNAFVKSMEQAFELFGSLADAEAVE